MVVGAAAGFGRRARRVALDDPAEDVPHRRADLRGVGLQREVAGVQEAHLRVEDVAPVGFGAGREEVRVVLAPDRQQRRPVRPEVLLEGRL